MQYNCPHCGHPVTLDIKKADVTKAKAVAQPKGDLKQGIVKATADAVEEKMDKSLGFLDKFNKSAAGSFGKSSAGLGDGYAQMTQELMRRREEALRNGIAIGSAEDVASGGKASQAAIIQNALLKGLSKGD